MAGGGAPKTNMCTGSSGPDLAFVFERSSGTPYGPSRLALYPADRASREGRR